MAHPCSAPDNLPLLSALRDRLRVEDLTQHPLMLAEPTFNTRELRERLTEIAFEQFGSPALFLAKNAALSAYATGRQTALVADAGHEGTVGEQVCLLIWRLMDCLCCWA